VRVTLLLEENDLCNIIKNVVTPSIDPQELVGDNKRVVKAKWMILDAINDHLIPHVSKKKTVREMFDALVSLYQSQDINMKMVLRNKLRSIMMTRSDIVTSYLMKITQIFDQLVAVGEKVGDAKWIPNFMGTICQRYLHSGKPS